MESQKNRFVITSHLMHGKDAGKGLTKQEFIIPALLTDSLKTPDTVKFNQAWVEKKLSAKKLMT